MKRLVVGNWYRVKDTCTGKERIGQYMGRQDFSCCVCDKGCNAKCFNYWYKISGCDREDYETLGYGNEHLPEVIEDLGRSNEVIFDLI